MSSSVTRKIIGATSIISISTVVTTLLGYIRDMIIVAKFGASETSDAWYTSIVIPELIHKFLLFGALGSVFVPIFTNYLTNKTDEEAWEIASSVLNISAIFLFLASIISFFLAPVLMIIFAPGFSDTTHILATNLTKTMVPVVFFMGLTGLLTGIHHSYLNFIVPVICSNVMSIVPIIFLLIFAKTLGIFSLSYGTLVGSILSLFIIIFGLKKRRLYRPKINLKHPAIRQMITIMIPLIGSEIIGKSIGIVDRMFGSTLDPGSVTALQLGNRLMFIPIFLISTSSSSAIFPVLSKQVAQGKMDDFKSTFSIGIKFTWLLLFPIAMGMIILAKPIVTVLFERGEFNANNTNVTTLVLIFLAFAIPTRGITPLLMRVCHSLRKNWILFRFELLGLILNAILDFILIKYMGIAGIALSTSISIFILVSYTLKNISKVLDGLPWKEIMTFLGKVFLSTCIMGLVCYAVFNLSQNLNLPYSFTDIVNILITTICGIFTYALCLIIFKIEEFNIIRDKIKHLRFNSNKTR